MINMYSDICIKTPCLTMDKRNQQDIVRGTTKPLPNRTTSKKSVAGPRITDH